jgi:hypothetical protein
MTRAVGRRRRRARARDRDGFVSGAEEAPRCRGSVAATRASRALDAIALKQ